jgi:hypothetical protein
MERVQVAQIENTAGDFQGEREAIAFLGLSLGRRHQELLDLLLAHPLLNVQEMATLLGLESSSIEHYLREVRNGGCTDVVATHLGPRWRLSGRGLHLVAAMHHLSVRSIAIPAELTEGEETNLVQRGLEVLLRHLEHTVGVYGFFLE